MEKLITYYITSDLANQTVESLLRKIGYSNHLLIKLRRTKHGLTINKELVYTTYKLKEGETLFVRLLEDESSDILPTPMELSIVYEDDDIIVINKESNQPIHPSQGNYNNTLANGMAHYFKEKGETFIYRAINRLDRDTTGLLILARHSLSACILNQMIKEHSIQRTYLAIVKGYLDSEGTIKAPIARQAGSTIERCIDFTQGEYASTHYKCLEYRKDLDHSLAQIRLETGRTHQIRVHMNYIGHPLPGDFLYCPDYTYFHRQTLHSHQLNFHHPLTKKPLTFTSPLPPDMANYFNSNTPS